MPGTDPPPADPAAPRVIPLPGGGAVEVRTATADDLTGVLALYDELSLEDRHRRFFSACRPSELFLRTWLDADAHGGHASVAIARTNASAHGTIVAEAGYLPLPAGGAEFAVTVASRWRGWLGPYLLDRLVQVAAARGLTSLEAQVLLENQAMLAVLRARGYVTYDHSEFDVVQVLIGTGERTPHWPDHHERPRILVEVPGARWHATPAVRADGMHVVACPGPASGARCPALGGAVCPLAATADAIVVALRPGDPNAVALAAAHRRLHADIPLVVVQQGRGESLPEGACALAAGAPSGEILRVLHELVDR